jgi:hypothetical protein
VSRPACAFFTLIAHCASRCASQGVTIGDKKGGEGGVVITGVSGNGAKAGLKVGDTVLYTSSFFGDELWPADKAAFTRTAINAKQNDVDFVRTLAPLFFNEAL